VRRSAAQVTASLLHDALTEEVAVIKAGGRLAGRL
jgi:hypothetical protein